MALTPPPQVSRRAAISGVPKELRPGGEYDRFIAERAAADRFSGTVLLTHHGRPVLERSYGHADEERAIRNTAGTLFDVASITKCCTAVAIAQLAERGEVAYHEKLGTYLDGFKPEAAGAVTVHHLLTHTSGLDRPGPPSNGNSVEEVWNRDLESIRAMAPAFPPGAEFRYSNGGYFLLGAIVAEVSGQSYYDYIRDHVLTPAGMARSGFYTRPQIRADRRIAHRYTTDRQTGRRYDFTESDHLGFIGRPDHGLYCTAGELLAFARALRSDRLIDPSLITSGKMVLAPSVKPDLTRQIMHYCYGFFHTVLNRREIISHSGTGPGMANMLDIHPGSGWTSVILGNFDTPVDPIVNLGRELITRFTR
ncbi:hypothetical protein DP939_32820 [Spongiactinospora rosea]|uniref:Beta-lactamase-related domain-containing protein n=1 Tax=Spongiactinospora rosea TaxID=2248750 RepID=A0A366LQJ0_9ACTN|nr:serine hydrolase domain-containing protein [Spongiactinospora rosea]RBQ15803.1 hypothetical protein DP939_32820 [Spongiactinospora rosea]